MSKLLYVSAGLIGGYALGVAAGATLIELFSANTHDKSMEMAMTSAFVTGPIGAIIGAVVGYRKSS